MQETPAGAAASCESNKRIVGGRPALLPSRMYTRLAPTLSCVGAEPLSRLLKCNMNEPTAHLVYEFADFQVDPTQRLLVLSSGGRPLPLSPRAFDALVYFLEHRGQLLEKSTLMEAIWPTVVVEQNNLNQHISTLRRVLGESRDEHRFIVTVPGRGYRFVADVTVRDLSKENLSAPAPDTLPELWVTPTAEAPVTRAVSKAKPWLRCWGWGAATALLLTVVLMWSLRPGPLIVGATTHPHAAAPVSAPPVSATRAPLKLRLAILPFDNLSPDPANAFFTDGLHEEIVSTLGERLAGVEVISRTTMTSGRFKAQPVATIVRELGATHVMEGSVRRESKRVRVTLQLIDAATDQHVWSKSYDRTLESALTLQSEVANELATQLSVELPVWAHSAEYPTQDTEAYDDYLKAVVALRSMLGDTPREAFQSVDETLSRAVARDPRFALAYAQRARAGTLRYIIFGDSSRERIREDLAHAKSLSPREPIVVAAEGFYLFAIGENAHALAVLNDAESLGLTDPTWLVPKARVLLRMGRVEETLRTQRRMLDLDPANPLVISFTAEQLMLLRQPAEVLRLIQLVQTQIPDMYQYYRGRTLLDFAGRTQELREFTDRFTSGLSQAEMAANPVSVCDWFDLLRFEHRYQELDRFLRQMPPGLTPYVAQFIEMHDLNLGNVPAAEQLGGWTALLRGDTARAARAGRSLLDFVKSRKATPRIAFMLYRLEAEGHLFAGEPEAAIRAAKASLDLVPRERDAVSWIGVATMTARVYAWAGARDQAVRLLGQLATATPGLAPSYIIRDPLIVVPLAREPHYQALAERLQGQMIALNLN